MKNKKEGIKSLQLTWLCYGLTQNIFFLCYWCYNHPLCSVEGIWTKNILPVKHSLGKIVLREATVVFILFSIWRAVGCKYGFQRGRTQLPKLAFLMQLCRRQSTPWLLQWFCPPLQPAVLLTGQWEHQALQALHGLVLVLVHQITQTLPTQAPGSHQQQHTLLKTGTCSAAAFAAPSQLMQCFQTLHHALNVSFILAPLALHGSKTMSTFLGLIEASTLNGDWRLVGRKVFCRHIAHSLQVRPSLWVYRCLSPQVQKSHTMLSTSVHSAQV